MNILFLMVDQLRFDYLGCTGHPSINTPNIDALARHGVRFNRAYVQSPICGPSRMSFYTGRYVRSHGATWNNIPLQVGEMTLGDHLRPLGIDTILCGKTHMTPDLEGMARLGIDPASVAGRRISECGFDVWERHDGEFPKSTDGEPSPYQDYLQAKGYAGPNPWNDWANSGEGPAGASLSGWLLKHARAPARVANEDSESPWITSRAIEFINQAGSRPWCLHVSYIKPHWPYVAPSPYNDLYGPDDVLPVVRSDEERTNPHPVLAAFQNKRVSRAWSREDVRGTVIPTYMGLITQIDDEVGRLLRHLDDAGQRDNTLIVFASDHGDYLGDHWLGEKELFHEVSARFPLIIADPRPEADGTRGDVCDALVEAIDLVPTFVEAAGGTPRSEILEGRSLLGHLHGRPSPAREFVISEYDYSCKSVREDLDRPVGDCRMAMIFDGRWKLVHAEGFRPMLYDLETDPDEFLDRGDDPAASDARGRLMANLNAWYRRHHNRTTISDSEIKARSGGDMQRGIYLGFWDESDLAEAERLGRSGI